MLDQIIKKLIASLTSQTGIDPSQFTQAELEKLPEVWGQALGSGKKDSATKDLLDIVNNANIDLEAANTALINSPQGQKAMAENMRKKKKAKLSEAASEGMDFLATFAEVATTMRNIAETKQDLAGIAPPTAPAIPSKSKNIAEAVEMARERAYNPYSSSEVNALIGAQGMDTLKGLQTAKQVSGGQASSYQANAQDAIDRSRFAKIQSAGVLQEGSRQAEGQFLQASGVESQEAMQRASLQQRLYGMKSQNYMFDKGMADAALSAQRGNLMTSLQNAEVRLPNAIGGGLARLYNKPTYSGMGQTVDNQDAYAHKTLNRMRNQSMLYDTDYGSTGSLASTYKG